MYYWHKINDVRVKKDTPPEPLINYCQGSLNAHAIELRVPGYLTFRNRKTKQKEKEIRTYDVRIRLVKNEQYVAPKHTEIAEDLFQKLYAIEDEVKRKKCYDLLATVLINIYMNRIVLTDEVHGRDRKWCGQYSLVELISFIKCCAAQESLNYCQPEDWGMDLSFARYFEALAAGMIKDRRLLEEVISRTKNNDQGKPKLWEKDIYFQLLNHRF